MFVNYLLNKMDVDKNMFKWAYCLIKYGDMYLRLYRESDYEDPLFDKQKIDQVQNASSRSKLNESIDKLQESVNLHLSSQNDKYSYYVEMVDDPSTMYELDKLGVIYGYVEVPSVPNEVGSIESLMQGTTALSASGSAVYNYRLKKGDVNIYQADDFVHAYLDDNFTRFPETVEIFRNDEDYTSGKNSTSYSVKRGKSLLYDSFKIWREKSLLESAALLNRVTRSSIVRPIGIEVGDMPKEQAQQVLHRFKELFEQKSAIDTGNGMQEYTNPSPTENNIYYTTHNGQGAITISSVGGDVNIKDLADLDWWNNKFYSSYGIPKQYFGWTDDGAGFNAGSSLTILSSVYAHGVRRVQNALLQALTDAINLFLLNNSLLSYKDNFKLKMKRPVTQDEIDYRTALTNRIAAVSNMNSLFSDLEDKVNRLTILREQVKSLDASDKTLAAIDREIKQAQEAAVKAKAEEEAAAKEEALRAPSEEAVDDFDLQADELSEDEPNPGGADIDLPPMPETFSVGGGQTLVEGPDFMTEDEDLPTPEEANGDIDFSENV